MTTINDLLKREGRSQVWLRDKLLGIGIKRNPSTINMYCTGKKRPGDDYILYSIAHILNIDTQEVIDCFENNEDGMTF